MSDRKAEIRRRLFETLIGGKAKEAFTVVAVVYKTMDDADGEGAELMPDTITLSVMADTAAEVHEVVHRNIGKQLDQDPDYADMEVAIDIIAIFRGIHDNLIAVAVG